MEANSVIAAASVQTSYPVQQEITMHVLKEQQESEKEMVAQILSGPAEVPSQVYNGHGQVVPSGGGSRIDMRM